MVTGMECGIVRDLRFLTVLGGIDMFNRTYSVFLKRFIYLFREHTSREGGGEGEGEWRISKRLHTEHGTHHGTQS